MKHLTAGLVLAWLSIACAQAGEVTLTWTQDTSTCADGTPAATNCPLTGTDVYQGTGMTDPAYSLRETLAPALRTVRYTNVAPGTRCYFLKAVSNGTKSPESTRACADVPFVSPRAPQGVTVRVEITVTPE